MSKGNALTADAALSHFDTSKNTALASEFFILLFVIYKSASDIIAYRYPKCKSFLKFFQFFILYKHINLERRGRTAPP